MDFSQIVIFIFGSLSIWFVSRKEKWKRWGYIFGMIAQPFWFYVSIENKQWGIVAVSFIYTYSWGMGIYNYWIKK